MNCVRQSAGNCHIEVYIDGAALWPDLRIVQINGETVEGRLSVHDLHDLRYCVDRVLSQLAAGKPA